MLMIFFKLRIAAKILDEKYNGLQSRF